MLPRIFIGGTGRSGTTILYQALGCHKDIFALPTEMRFLIDPDGLINLIDALTDRYSHTHSREGLYKFERLMRIFLTTPERAPYRNFDLASWLGEDYYWHRLDEFCSELTQAEFHGNAWPVEPDYEGRLVIWAKQVQKFRQMIQGEPVVPFRLALPRPTLKAARYFSNRQELITLAASFVDDLFLKAAFENGKSTWCEKTPENLFHIKFIWELFPDSVFLHIKRDPRGIVYSLTKQPWGPNDLENASLFLTDMYDRWFDIKASINLDRYRYLEITLEELAVSPQTILENIASFCGLQSHYDELPKITPEKVNYWQKKMTDEDIQLVNEILDTRIKLMGYSH